MSGETSGKGGCDERREGVRSIVWRRLGVCLAWACFILSCALWVWAEAPRGPSVSSRLSDPDGGMVPKAPTKEEAVQMAQVNREFAVFLKEVEENQAKAKNVFRISRVRFVLACQKARNAYVRPLPEDNGGSALLLVQGR